MAKVKKSWREKLNDSKDLPKLVDRDSNGTMVVPSPLEVDGLMRKVPKGKLTTINDIRSALSGKHGAATACPMTTGIFAWIAAWASAEDEARGAKRFTPFWRTLRAGGELNPKYPGGIDLQTRRLVAEGHEVTTKGKRAFVTSYEKSLARL